MPNDESTLYITIRRSEAVRYASRMSRIVTEVLDLVPDWQRTEADELARRFRKATRRLLKHGFLLVPDDEDQTD